MKNKKNLEGTLKKETLLDAVLENMPDGFLAVDKNRKILRSNQLFADMWGIPKKIIQSGNDEQTLKTVLDKLIDPEEFLNRVNSLYTNGYEKSNSEEIALKDGRTFERNSFPIKSDSKNGNYGRVWYFRDITNRKNLSIMDPLTNLYNKRYFREAISKEVHKAERYNYPLSISMIDIDYFKKINDTYGHPYGDEILVKVGNVFLKNTRKSDTVARYGGEEFAIIFPETNLGGAIYKGETIRSAVKEIPLKISPEGIKMVTISIGTSEYKPGENISSLLKRADKNLYHAKEGRDRQCAEI